MNLRQLLRQPSTTQGPPAAGRTRAPNGTTPAKTRLYFTVEQREKLARRAAARGVSVSQIVRDLIDGLP